MKVIAEAISRATDRLCGELDGLSFSAPVTHVYNPLVYARKPHQQYLERFGGTKKKAIFLGMNPGPWGMAQTGVPFGEVPAVRDWMGISAPVCKPRREHPRRPIEGFSCRKSEVSGRRLWGLFAERFASPEAFFKDHYVVNYCPLVWMEESGRNRTPDKLPAGEMEAVHTACDAYVRAHLEEMEPRFVIGVGAFAEACLVRVCEQAGLKVEVGRILHPSPASPAANRDWAGTAAAQLAAFGVWKSGPACSVAVD